MTAFDEDWRTRLAGYDQTPEFAKNLAYLIGLINPTLPPFKTEPAWGFVFVGIPGSGKSLVSKVIRRFHPAVVIAADWIFFKALVGERKLEEYYNAYFYRDALAKHYFAQGYSVVFDGGHRRAGPRAEILSLIREAHARPILIQLETDLDRAAMRRVRQGGEFMMPWEEHLKDTQNFLDQLEELTPTEETYPNFLIDTNQDAETVTLAVLAGLRGNGVPMFGGLREKVKDLF